ncbi:DUF2303 family protein [Klebsiella pneumoniae]|uniref:DUF2303 family protein n=1 Tax=Klebsiella pneumoniae TaxID=573 RepID=UPI0031F73871
MSQQLDSSAINQIKDLVLSGYHLNDIHGLACPTTILPEGTTVASLERFALERYRFRGAMDTTSIDDFVRYSVGYAQEDEKARCFIDADNMLARSIFNIGTLDNPGHADNVASIKLKKTAPFRALLSINGDHLNQKQIAEWLEDWSDYLIAFDADGNTMKIAQAAQAVRRVTIQQTNASDHEDGDFSGKKSLMQSIEASSKDVMPVAFGLPAEQHPTVKYADLVMLASERRDFEIDDGTHWPMLDGIIPTDQFVINPVRPGQSYGMFMNRFNQLVERR